MPAFHTHSEMSHCGLSNVYVKELVQTQFEVSRNISTEIYSAGLRLDLETPVTNFTSKSQHFQWNI